MKSLGILALIAILAGCSTSSVLVGKARPPINPAAVKVYLTAPPKYEEIALVTATSESSWAISDQGKMNAVMEGLKKEAAKVGANGILLRETGDKSTQGFMVAPAYGGTFTAASYAVQNKAATAVAIYVPPTEQ